jgi:hypothetical protein
MPNFESFGVLSHSEWRRKVEVQRFPRVARLTGFPLLAVVVQKYSSRDNNLL